MSWYQLLEIWEEVIEDTPIVRVEQCPRDGTTLTAGVDGSVRCPFDGWPVE